MIRRPTRSTRTDTLFPYSTLFRRGAMTMSDHQLAQRERRARLLAAAPDWRASDARVDPRVAIGSIVAMWLLYFLITTSLAVLSATPEPWADTAPHPIAALADLFITLVPYNPTTPENRKEG